jgi:hypothetical protein
MEKAKTFDGKNEGNCEEQNATMLNEKMLDNELHWF